MGIKTEKVEIKKGGQLTTIGFKDIQFDDINSWSLKEKDNVKGSKKLG